MVGEVAMIAKCINEVAGITKGKVYAVLGICRDNNGLKVYIVDDLHQDEYYPTLWDAKYFKVTGIMQGKITASYDFQRLSLTVIYDSWPSEFDDEEFFDRSLAENVEVYDRFRKLSQKILSGHDI